MPKTLNFAKVVTLVENPKTDGKTERERKCIFIPTVVGKIIENKDALAQMFEKYDDIGFKEYYEQHFIQKRNQFTQPTWDALSSFCATLTMCKWH